MRWQEKAGKFADAAARAQAAGDHAAALALALAAAQFLRLAKLTACAKEGTPDGR